jgi:hypothetical protein
MSGVSKLMRRVMMRQKRGQGGGMRGPMIGAGGEGGVAAGGASAPVGSIAGGTEQKAKRFGRNRSIVSGNTLGG